MNSLPCKKKLFLSWLKTRVGRILLQFGAEDSIRNTQSGHKSLEESYDAVVIANHEALTKLLDQVSSPVVYSFMSR